GFVHERLGLQQRDAVAVEADLREPAGELALPGCAVPTRELLDDHPADVVPVAGVFATRIAEADDEQLERRGPVASPPRQPHWLTLGLFARARVFGWGLAFGSALGRLALRRLAFRQLLALRELLRLRLDFARRQADAREHGL